MIADINRILSFDWLRNIWLHSRLRQAEVARSDPRVDFFTPGDHSFGVANGLLGDYGNVGASSLQLLSVTGHQWVLLLGTDGRYPAARKRPGDQSFSS